MSYSIDGPPVARHEQGAANDAAVAAGWLHTARFLTTAAQLHHLPALDLPEVAFVGRSNAGKSTCINTLTQQKQLAFASKKPGRTQHINLFALGRHGIDDAILADLPGYGYAAVPKLDKARWQQVMANYLVSRTNLVGIVLLTDPAAGLDRTGRAAFGSDAPARGARLEVAAASDQGRQIDACRRRQSAVDCPTAGGHWRGHAVFRAEAARPGRGGHPAVALDTWSGRLGARIRDGRCSEWARTAGCTRRAKLVASWTGFTIEKEPT